MTRIVLIIVYYLANVMMSTDYSIVFATLPMMLMILYFVSRSRSPYVLFDDMLWLMAYIFFVISPIQTYSNGYFSIDGPVKGISFTTGEIVEASAVIFVFYLVFAVSLSKMRQGKPFPLNYEMNDAMAAALLAISVIAFALFVLSEGGFGNVLASRSEKDATLAFSLLWLCIQMVTTFMLAALAFDRRSLKPFALFAFAVCAAFLLVSQNPVNTPRYYFMQTWLPIIFIAMNGKIRAAYFYIFVFFALIFLMPIFNFVGRGRIDFYEALSRLDIDTNLLTLPFVDVFDMTAYAVKRHAEHGLYWGSKTLGLFLFFIPRAIWTSKATLAGEDLGYELYDAKIAGTWNLSFHVAGDFYADFGLLGSALGGFVMALTTYVVFFRKTYLINGNNIKLYLLLSALPILTRGPLGANVGLLFIEMFVLLALVKLFTKLCAADHSLRSDFDPIKKIG